MKSAEQWMDSYDPAWADDRGPTMMTVERIREIQTDAIKHAAEVARLTRTCGGGNLTIASRITMEIDRLQTR